MKDIKLNNGDINIVNGRIATVSKHEKLNQQLGKIVLTNIGFYLHPDYGSRLVERLGKGQAAEVDSEVKADIRGALDHFIFLQQEKVRLKAYDFEEILYKVLSIKIERPDPRAAHPVITFMSADMETLEFDMVV